jgi:DNA-binding response OmpR family regulator
VAPEVLIVGDASRRAELLARISGLGYAASVCTRGALEQRIAKADPPGAVLVCTEDVDARALMASLRGTRRGSGVPVTLYGPVPGRTGDLADVLDLGADHFLEAPATDEALAAALELLLGPAGRPPAGSGGVAGLTGSITSAHAGGREPGDTDAVLGQLHRTLDLLEARLREREGSGDADELDLDALGVHALPEMGDADTQSGPTPGSLSLPLSTGERSTPTPPAGARRDPTERLGHQPEGHANHQPEARAAEPDPRRLEVTASRPVIADDRPRRHAPLPIEDRGSLDRLEVPRLLWALHRARYTGALSLEHGRVDKRMWFHDGDIVLVRSNVGHDRLLDGLLRRGLLARDQYEVARQLAAKEPGRTGALLVEAGLLKATELPRVLRDHLVGIIDSTFPWTDGRWTLAPGEEPDEVLLADTPVSLVVAEGVRHRMESAQLVGLLGGLEQRPRFRGEAVGFGGPHELAEHLRLSPSEEAWLPRLDGTATLREILARPDTDELELLALCYVLHVLEHLELGAELPVAAANADPVALDVARIRDRLQLAREDDYFASLGLPRDAARLDVRRAHAELHRTFADAHLEPSVRTQLRAELEELRDLLDEARDVLVDEGLRSAYLAHLEDA